MLKRTNPETKLDRFWPGPERSQCPIAFCHVIGKEDDHKTGSKTTGGKKIGVDSKFNETEATKVVRKIIISTENVMYKTLTLRQELLSMSRHWHRLL